MEKGAHIVDHFIPGVEADADDSGRITIDGSCLSHISTPLPKTSQLFAFENVTRKDVLDYGDECFLLSSVLTQSESDHFVQEGEKIGFEKIANRGNNYRSSQRISFQNAELALLLWERIKNHVEDIIIEKDPREMHIDGPPVLMQGHWQPIGLNNVFRLCRYFPGDHFAPHNDGFFAVSATERSLKTFMIYLNGNFHGGSTNFVDPSQTLYMGPDGKYCAEEKNILYRVHPETGLAIIFNHNRLHEGQRIEEGVKYILRTDIMYKNLRPSALSQNEDKAIELLQMADRLESSGKCMEAMELYKKAFKMSPEVAQSYGF
ncbi:hypothetical protein EGW08_004571 [Elysia chlorotica]|uniref:Prolyl 4-hydroxylase alpha subunit domain-containing protein n=1 Tax=Elysia chlorotica TaxID=188477 RepID=A0A3S1A0L6_ELYCH|nr:hypothetical protein EGW08_004571 [Elysia chlorotica]